jgi:hypothetical protein
MPRASSHLWAVAQFDTTPDKDGKYECKAEDCTYKSTRHPANMRQHVKRVHGLNTPEKKRQRTLEEFTAIAPLTWDETCAAAFAINGWSFNSVDPSNEYLHEIVPRLPARKTLRAATLSAAKKLADACLKRIGVCTLCYDSGTVHRRYLLIVAATPSHAVVVRCKRFDTEMTSEAINEVLQEAKALIEGGGGFVIGMVADNAANMQSDGILGAKIRCSAHGLQLIIKDITSTDVDCKRGVEILDELGATHKLPRVPETRWSYIVLRLSAALPLVDTDLERRQTIERALALLQPLADATNEIQRDNATLFQSLCLWEKLLDHYGSQQRTTNAHQVVATRFQMMITEPCVALAFFAPVTVKTFENVTIVEDALEQYLSSIAAGCHDEFIRFKASAHRPSAGAVTLDSYRSYISNRIRPQYPTIATVLINLLAAQH